MDTAQEGQKDLDVEVKAGQNHWNEEDSSLAVTAAEMDDEQDGNDARQQKYQGHEGDIGPDQTERSVSDSDERKAVAESNKHQKNLNPPAKRNAEKRKVHQDREEKRNQPEGAVSRVP